MVKIRTVFDTSVSLVLVGCAVVAVSVMLRRGGSASSATGPSPLADSVRFVAGWQKVAASAMRMGSVNAPVTILEFGDFQCPACRQLHETLGQVLQRRKGNTALAFAHFPLGYHRFARPAAFAAECAGRAGHFAEMHDLLYEKQDSIGQKSWVAYARDAAVSDTEGFTRCMQDSTLAAKVDAHQAFGRGIPIRGTPTILVNGWVVPPPFTPDRLIDAIERAGAGEAPRKAR